VIPSKKRIIESSLVIVLTLVGLSGCTNKFNQTGKWLVTYDSTLIPLTFDSDSQSVKITTSQVNLGSANGANDTVLCLGSVPWTEADMLMEFYGIDSVYYATSIISAQVILQRSTYELQPIGYDVRNMQLEGYVIDSGWSASTVTWDSLARLPRESSDMILPPTMSEVSDTSVVFQIDTSVVRRWAKATQDTNYKNYGFLVKSSNVSGVVSVFSNAYAGTGYEPTIMVVCVINGVPDTVISTSSYSTYVANTSIVAPSQTFALQSGTGLHANVVFNLDSIRRVSTLDSIPAFSIVNYAGLTLHEDPIDSLYSGQSPDSLWAYYQSDPSTHAVSLSGYSLSTKVGRKYTFPVTVMVQQMLISGNYGFLITRSEDINNLDSRFIYNENAPDSLKPRLTITYTPAVKKK
jgi:hypothetical protein